MIYCELDITIDSHLNLVVDCAASDVDEVFLFVVLTRNNPHIEKRANMATNNTK